MEKEPLLLIVGAGVAGLQTARALLKAGFKVLVLEENEDVGGTWLRNYQGYGLQVPWENYQFAEFPLPRKAVLKEYPSGDEVREYVQAYARHFDLYRHILFSSRLVRLSRRTPSTPKTPSGAETQAPAPPTGAPVVPGAQVPKFNSEQTPQPQLPDPNGTTNSLYAGPATGGVGPRHSCPIGMVYGVVPPAGDSQAPGPNAQGGTFLAQNGPSVCGASGGGPQGPLEIDSGLLRSLSGMPDGAWGAPTVPPGAGDSRNGGHVMDLHQEAARRSGVPSVYGKQQQQQETGRGSTSTTATGMGATSGVHGSTAGAMVPPSPVATTAGAVASEASPAGKAGFRQLLLGGLSRGHSGAQAKQQQQPGDKISALHAHMRPPSGSHGSGAVIAAYHDAAPGSAGGAYGATSPGYQAAAAGAGAESTATGRVACYPSDVGSDGTPGRCAVVGAGGCGVSDLGGSIGALGGAAAAGASAAGSHLRSAGDTSAQQQQQQQQGQVQGSAVGKGGVGRNGKDSSASGRGHGALASEMMGGGWVAEYEDLCTGRRYVLSVSFVVLCTGLYASPFIPKIPGQELYRGLQVHSRNFTDAAVASGKRVLVVGGGKTAADVVTELTATTSAEEVTLLYRRPHWPLPRSLGPVSLKSLAYTRLISSALLPHYYAAGPGGRAAAAVLTPLRKAFWVTFMARVNKAMGIKKTLGAPDRPICQDIWYSGQVLDAVRWPEVINNAKVKAMQGEVARFTPVSAVLRDGTELQPDIVLYATGYSNQYRFLEDPEVRQALDVQADGLYLYRHMLVPGLPGLAFVGAEVSTFNNILTSGLQAEWLAAALRGRVRLPSATSMAEDVVAQRQWRRSTMPSHKLRGSAVMLYMQAYHDQLLRDMKLRTHRKRPTWRHPMAECFEPYTAHDYTDLFAEAAPSAAAITAGATAVTAPAAAAAAAVATAAAASVGTAAQAPGGAPLSADSDDEAVETPEARRQREAMEAARISVVEVVRPPQAAAAAAQVQHSTLSPVHRGLSSAMGSNVPSSGPLAVARQTTEGPASGGLTGTGTASLTAAGLTTANASNTTGTGGTTTTNNTAQRTSTVTGASSTACGTYPGHGNSYLTTPCSPGPSPTVPAAAATAPGANHTPPPPPQPLTHVLRNGIASTPDLQLHSPAGTPTATTTGLALASNGAAGDSAPAAGANPSDQHPHLLLNVFAQHRNSGGPGMLSTAGPSSTGFMLAALEAQTQPEGPAPRGPAGDPGAAAAAGRPAGAPSGSGTALVARGESFVMQLRPGQQQQQGGGENSALPQGQGQPAAQRVCIGGVWGEAAGPQGEKSWNMQVKMANMGLGAGMARPGWFSSANASVGATASSGPAQAATSGLQRVSFSALEAVPGPEAADLYGSAPAGASPPVVNRSWAGGADAKPGAGPVVSAGGSRSSLGRVRQGSMVMDVQRRTLEGLDEREGEGEDEEDEEDEEESELNDQDTLYSLDALPPALQAFRGTRTRAPKANGGKRSSKPAAAGGQHGKAAVLQTAGQAAMAAAQASISASTASGSSQGPSSGPTATSRSAAVHIRSGQAHGVDGGASDGRPSAASLSRTTPSSTSEQRPLPFTRISDSSSSAVPPIQTSGPLATLVQGASSPRATEASPGRAAAGTSGGGLASALKRRVLQATGGSRAKKDAAAMQGDSSRIEPTSEAVSDLAYQVLPPKHVEEALAAAAAATRATVGGGMPTAAAIGRARLTSAGGSGGPGAVVGASKPGAPPAQAKAKAQRQLPGLESGAQQALKARHTGTSLEDEKGEAGEAERSAGSAGSGLRWPGPPFGAMAPDAYGSVGGGMAAGGPQAAELLVMRGSSAQTRGGGAGLAAGVARERRSSDGGSSGVSYTPSCSTVALPPWMVGQGDNGGGGGQAAGMAPSDAGGSEADPAAAEGIPATFLAAAAALGRGGGPAAGPAGRRGAPSARSRLSRLPEAHGTGDGSEYGEEGVVPYVYDYQQPYDGYGYGGAQRAHSIASSSGVSYVPSCSTVAPPQAWQ